MIDLATLPPVINALVVVSAILVQAVALYVSYGFLEQMAGPTVGTLLQKVG